jgi:hypothetical protein
MLADAAQDRRLIEQDGGEADVQVGADRQVVAKFML